MGLSRGRFLIDMFICEQCDKDNYVCECHGCPACDNISDNQEDNGHICSKCDDKMKKYSNWEEGEVLDQLDYHDAEIEVTFIGDNGKEFSAVAMQSCGEIVEIFDIDWEDD